MTCVRVEYKTISHDNTYKYRQYTLDTMSIHRSSIHIYIISSRVQCELYQSHSNTLTIQFSLQYACLLYQYSTDIKT